MDSLVLRGHIIHTLEASGLPKLDETNFVKSHRPVSPGKGRSRLVSGMLKMRNGQSVNVVVKTLSASYAYRRKSSRDVPEYMEKLLAYFEREVDIWLRASGHHSVVRLMGFMPTFETEIFPALVIPNYSYGCLRTIVSKPVDILGERNKLILLRDVACGLAHLHGIGIIHRDIKAANILVTSDDRRQRIVARINDFGSAKLSHPIFNKIAKSTQSNSLAWAPPEYLDSETWCCSYSKPTPAGDMWSFGCTFLEVFIGSDPWKRSIDVEEQLEKKRHPPLPMDLGLPTMYIEFMMMCWHLHPELRITAEQAVDRLDFFISLTR